MFGIGSPASAEEKSSVDKMENKQKNEHWKEALQRLSEDYKRPHKLKGQPKSEEHKLKLSLANKGQKPWNMGLKGNEYFNHLKEGKIWNKGMKGYKIHTEEHKEKLKESMTGNKYREGSTPWNKGMKGKYTLVPCPKEKKIRISNSLKGQRLSEERKGKIGKANKKFYENNPEALLKLKERRKYLVMPKKDTSIEVKIQNFLKSLGIEFFTHQYMKEIEHGYQCDVFIPSMNLVVECDGDYWHRYPTGTEIDHIRTKELIGKGFKVLRLWEREIKIMDIDHFNKLINKNRSNI